MAKMESRIDVKIAPPGYGRYLIAIAAIVAIYLFYMNAGFTATRMLNKLTASGGAFLVILSFLLGPIAWKFFPKLDPSEYRKFFGMIGFSLLALHALVSFSFSSSRIFTLPNMLMLLAGVTSFALFALLAATSSDVVFQGLGFEKWKKLQRLGYLALVIAIIHFVLVGGGAFANSALGYVIISLASITILWRAYFVMKGGN